MLLKTDLWLGWTKCRQTRTKPLSPLKLRFGKDWRGSSEVSCGCGGLRGDLRRSPSWSCCPRDIASKTNVKLEGFKLANFEFRGLTDATADNVCRDICLFLGCFEHDDVAGNDLANFTVSTHRAGLMKQLFFSDSGKRSLLARSR